MLIDNILTLHDSPLKPRLTLLKPDRTPITVVSTAYDIARNVQLANTNELTFTLPYLIDGKTNIQCEQCLDDYLVHFELLDEIGNRALEEYYMVTNPQNKGKTTYERTVSCYSIEHAFSRKLIQGYEGVKVLFRTDAEIATWTPTPQYPTLGSFIESGILNYILLLMPNWKIGTIDSELLAKYRDVKVDEQTVLSFLRGNAQSSFQCVFLFDSINQTISAKLLENIGHDNGLLLSDFNYIENFTMNIKADEVVTKLYLYGNDNISIASINPSGEEFILNLEYYKDTKYMSQDLINALDAYDAKQSLNEGTFETLISDRAIKMTDLTDAQSELATAKEEYEAEKVLRDILINNQENVITWVDTMPYIIGQYVKHEVGGIIKYYTAIADSIGVEPPNVSSWQPHLKEANTKISDKESIRDAKQSIVNDKTDDVEAIDNKIVSLKYNMSPYIDTNLIITYSDSTDYNARTVVKNDSNYYVAIKDAPNTVSITNTSYWYQLTINFTYDQVLERDKFIKEKTFRSDDYIDADELYEKGLELSTLYAQPPVELSLDIVDFMSLVEYQHDWDKLNIGDIIHVKHSVFDEELNNKSKTIEMRLIGFNHDYEKNALKIDISNRSRFEDSYVQLKELIDRATNTSASLDINKFQYAEAVNQTDVIKDYFNSTLSFAKHKALTSTGEKLRIDDSGITLTNISNDDKQVKMMSDQIVFTDDGWQSAKTAISSKGVSAETVVGILGAFCEVRTNQLIVGSTLIQDDLIRSDRIDALETFKDVAFLDIKTALEQSIADSKMETFYQPDEPTWTNENLVHEGDYWYNTTAKTLSRYKASSDNWELIQDQTAIDAVAAAGDAQSTADSKIVTFYQDNQPTNEESSYGDLWVDTNDGNRLWRYNSSIWEDIQDQGVKDYKSFVSVQYETDKAAFNKAISDGRIETFYTEINPNTWIESDRDIHEGDLWYNITAKNLSRYNSTTNLWEIVEDQIAIDAVEAAGNAQTTADGKIVTFYQNEQPTGGTIGDLWVDTNDGNRLWRYNGTTWNDVQDKGVKDYRSFVAGQYLTDKAAFNKAISDGRIETFYTNIDPNTWLAGARAIHEGDLWYNTTAKSLSRYKSISNEWELIQDQMAINAVAAASDAQSTADGKIVTFYQTTQPTGSTIGDIWVDTNDGNKLWRYNGTTWNDIQDQGVKDYQNFVSVQYIADKAAFDKAISDGRIETFYTGTNPNTWATGDRIIHEGDLWYNTTAKTLSRYNSTSNTWGIIQDQTAIDAIAAAGNAQTTADGKIVTFYQDTQPTGSTVGDLWVDTNDGNKIYRYNGSTWNDIQDQGIKDYKSFISIQYETDKAAFNKAISDGRIETFYTGTNPNTWSVGDRTIHEGDLWYNTTAKSLSRYKSTTNLWEIIQDQTAINAVAEAAENAQTTADGKIVTFYQTTQPTGGTIGDLWVDTNDGNRLWRYNGSIWNDVQDQGVKDYKTFVSGQYLDDKAAFDKAISDGRIETFYTGTNPNTWSVADRGIHEGDLWYNTTTVKLSRYKASSNTWETINDQTAIDAVAAASTAQTTADGKIMTYYTTTAPTGMVAGDVGDLWVDTNDGNKLYRYSGSNWVDVQDIKAGNSLQEDQSYNGTVINAVDGITVTATNSSMTTMLNATDGITIGDRNVSNTGWDSKLFYADTDGRLQVNKVTATDLEITSGKLIAGGQTMIDVGTRTLNFSGFSGLSGAIPPANLELKGLTIKNASNETTLAIDSNGNITLGGNITWNTKPTLSYNDLTSKPYIPDEYTNTDVQSFLTGERGMVYEDNKLKVYADSIIGGEFTATKEISIGSKTDHTYKKLIISDDFYFATDGSGDSMGIYSGAGKTIYMLGDFAFGGWGDVDFSQASMIWGDNEPQAVFK